MTESRDIYDILTERYCQDFKDLVNDEQHAHLCNCWVCLWRQYEKRSRPKGGRKYDLVSFLVFSLIHDVKLAYLIKEGIAKRKTWQGKEVWSYPVGKLKKVGYINPVKRILKAVPGFGAITPEYLKTYADCKFERYFDQKRYRSDKFLNLLTELEHEILSGTQKAEPAKQGRRPKHRFRIMQDVADFVYSQPEKKASQREILRACQTIDRRELEGMKKDLEKNFEIYSEQEGRSIVYYGEMKDSRGRFWTVGIKPNKNG